MNAMVFENSGKGLKKDFNDPRIIIGRLIIIQALNGFKRFKMVKS